MSNLKNLVVKANSGLTLRSEKSKNSFGLGSFIAASSSEMLMTRGGYGPPNWAKQGGGVNVYTSDRGSLIGRGGSSVFGRRNPLDRGHTVGPHSGNTSTSRIPGYYNIAVKKVSEWVTPDNIIGLGGRLIGFLFTTGETGKGSAKTDNPNYKGE